MQTWAMRLFLGLSLTVIPTAASADDVDAILKRWSEHLAKRPVKGLHGTARLYLYDAVFQIESRGRAEFWISGPEEWRIDSAPADVGKEKSLVVGAFGMPYTLRPLQRHDRWSQSATEVTQAAGNTRGLPDVTRFDLQQLPGGRSPGADQPLAWFFAELFRPLSEIPLRLSETMPGIIQLACSGPTHDPNSFSFCRHENWKIPLGSAHRQRGRIHLVFLPNSEPLQRSFSQVEVLLNEADFTPIGVRTHDPAGTSNCVYAFEWVGHVPYDDDPFGLSALAKWPPECRADHPPPPPVATRLAD
jgi:hypothetical protein